MQHVNITFAALQGLTMLVSQKFHDLEKLKAIFINKGGAKRPLMNFENDDDILVGGYSVIKLDAEGIIKDFGFL